MKIKRFHAKDMRTTIRQVRDELGPDAVILSNRRVTGGIEIVAALDYDESLMPAVPESRNDVPDMTVEERYEKRLGQPAEQPNELEFELNAEKDRFHSSKSAAIPETQVASEFSATDFNIPFTDDVQQKVSFEKSSFEQNSVQQNNFSPEKQAAAEIPAPHMWSQEPAIVAMQDELKSLRGLLVNQLSGLAWGQESHYHPLRARLLQRLLALGLSPTLAQNIAGQCDENDNFEQNWRLALAKLARSLPMAEQDIIEKGGIVALVGATGVGKTTTIAKLAARYTLEHGAQSVVLITTDNHRVAAHEQLRSYARILGVPMRVAGDADGLQSILHGFSDKGLILIDTAGMSQHDMHLNEELAMLSNSGSVSGREIHIYLTMAANSQRRVLEQVAQSFKAIPLAGSILTKLDETTSLGGALSVALEQSLPMAYFCDGQQVPEDIHKARPHSLVSRSVAILHQLAASSNRDEMNSLTVQGMIANANG
ncbi:MAG: flagellar biosynthesis protein FlhF [Gammaproteobacteria bacterium]|nr:flagellar biosynthesis protein FlhF [Gammaproteobacteria bacterium]